MKTNRFEETIRKKLEGIQPEFADEDWNRFQKYYKANTPGSFWKSYRSKIAYGAAASFVAGLSVACGLLYYQNTALREEIAELKQIVNRYERPENEKQAEDTKPEARDSAGIAGLGANIQTATPVAGEETGRKTYNIVNQDRKDGFSEPSAVNTRSIPPGEQTAIKNSDPGESVSETQKSDSGNARFQPPGKTIAGPERVSVAETGMSPENTANREIVPVTGTGDRADDGRMPEPAGLSEILRENKPGERPERKIAAFNRILPGTTALSEKKAVKSPKNAEPLEQKNILPTFITSRPYRIGLTGSRTKNMYSFGVVNEFLLFPNVSVTWGVNRTRYDQLEFFNEKVFSEQTGQNFRKAFGNGAPLVGDIMNITTYSSLTQIPLFAGYRQPLPGGFVLTGSVGTHLNIRFRQTLEYDFWDGHKLRKVADLKYRKLNYPVVNNFSPVLGAEKIFDPIVIQAEAYYHFQNKDIPYVDSPGGFGGRLKLLYQFGR